MPSGSASTEGNDGSAAAGATQRDSQHGGKQQRQGMVAVNSVRKHARYLGLLEGEGTPSLRYRRTGCQPVLQAASTAFHAVTIFTFDRSISPRPSLKPATVDDSSSGFIPKSVVA